MQTQTFESPGVSNHYDPEKNKARNRSMVRIRVKNRGTANLQVPGGNVIEPGEREFVCYDDDVPGVMSMVEPKPESIAIARERYMLAIAKQVFDRLDSYKGTMEELAHEIEHNPTAEQATALKYVLEVTPSSVEGAFYDLTGRSLKPLEWAKVIDEGIPEPQRVSLRIEQEKHATVMANAMRDVLNPGATGIDPAELEEIIAKRVAAEVAKLLGEKAPAKK